MTMNRRIAFIGAIIIAVIILLTVIAAPSTSKINSGSTYSRAPDGYGAWYAFMQERGTPIQRWQQPLANLTTQPRPVTLLRVYSGLIPPRLNEQEEYWLEQGNRLVILGVRTRAIAEEFSSLHKSPFGDVKIDTRRRYKAGGQFSQALGDKFGAVVWRQPQGKGEVIFATTPYLAANAYQDFLSNFNYLADIVSQKENLLFVDEYIHGYKDSPHLRKQAVQQREEAVITREQAVSKREEALNTGEPDNGEQRGISNREKAVSEQEKAIASREQANADKQAITNREKAVSEREQAVKQREEAAKARETTSYPKQAISSRERAVRARERAVKARKSAVNSRIEADNLVTYLTNTPLFPALLQAGVVLLVLIWAKNQRFGATVPLETAEIENSQAYIQALAGVLQKAESTEFVVEMVGKEEQLQLQKALGLGQITLEPQVLIDAWVQHTGANPKDLKQVLQRQSRNRRISEQDLLSWLGKWQKLRL
ncbi:MAG: DUF4350 domain-containing protein [Nostocaceae cyanobacterium]|nr:DUF4350 domain-containing protein [Nostocaceae cyanobacterium]